MALLWSTGLTLLLLMCRRSRRFLRLFGPEGLCVLAAASVLRLLCPVEVPGAAVIPFSAILNPVHDFLKRPVAGIQTATGLRLLLLVWSTVALGKAVLLIVRMSQFRSYARRLPRAAKAESACRAVISPCHREKITVAIDSSISIPYVSGILHVYIVLPGISYTEMERRLIILHEYTHFCKRHLWYKLFAQFFVCAFWWFPCAGVLNSCFDDLLEQLCDREVICRLDRTEALRYADILLFHTEIPAKPKKSYACRLDFLRYSALTQRFDHLFDRIRGRQSKHKVLSLRLLVVVLVLVSLFSYSTLLQSSYQPEDFVLLESGYALMQNRDGTYTITANGQSNKIPAEYGAFFEAAV